MVVRRTSRSRIRAIKQRIRLARKRWITSVAEVIPWYRSYRDWKHKTKTWRYQQPWYSSYRNWRENRKNHAPLKIFQSNIAGTKNWLIQTEIKYGGKVRVLRGKISPFDPNRADKPKSKWREGGDRMLHHGYAKHYANFLKSFTNDRNQRIVICEFGILKGTGLAIWCDLFPNARCIGLDIDLSVFENNLQNLQNLGAFSKTLPELYKYDQFVESKDYLEEILNGDKIDICMDDGHHSEASIMTTMKSVLPHLNSNFVYFIEDNPKVYKTIDSEYPDSTIYSDGELTVVTSFHQN